MVFFYGHSQDVSLPADLRQHALTQYNASLFNPTFSLDRNNPQSVSFWTRWQWQNFDADPTTLFLNYTRSLNEQSAAGLGFFQHNTGIYFNTGAAANYAYEVRFNRLIKVSFGANIFGFQQQIADTRFPINPIPGIPQTAPTDDFILQVAPGFNISVENFSMSLASENLFDYNFTDKGANTATSDKIFMGMASYDFPVMASDSTAYLRPSIYLRTIPEQENQIGMNALFSTQKYWAQAGYNNFYGISVGAGGTVFNRFSLGALVEFGTSASLNSKDPSFEIVASYFLGKPMNRRKIVASGIDDLNQEVILANEELTIEEMREELRKAEEEANGMVSGDKKEVVAESVKEEETLDVQKEEVVEAQLDKKELERLANEQKALEKQQRKDSIATVKQEKEALALNQKLEEEQAKIAATEAKEAEKAAALLEKEQTKIAETKAKEEEKAAALAVEEKAKEEKRLADLKKEGDAKALAEADRIEQQRKLDAIEKAETLTKATELAEAKKAAEKAKLADEEEKAKKEAARIAQAEAIKVANDEAAAKAKEEADRVAGEESARLAREEAARVAKAAEARVAKEEVVTEEVKPQAGEKYEEVANEDGLEPGYYLIANVFGTKKYFDAFMGDLTKKGMQPKSFFRSVNKYNYAYLAKYNTISEARRARDSKFDGKYAGKTWIFRVVGK